MSVSNGGLPSQQTDTVFSVYPHQFPKLEEDDKIKTQEFLDACKGVLVIVDKLGTVFTPVKMDMQGNISKLSNKYDQNPEAFMYLEDMVLAEKEEGEDVAIDALMWLRRGLHFLVHLFEGIYADSQRGEVHENLGQYFKSAYSATLEMYHGWIGQQLFKVMYRLAPYKKDLFYTLALERHHKDEYVLRDMKIFTDLLRTSVDRLEAFYIANDLEVTNKV